MAAPPPPPPPLPPLDCTLYLVTDSTPALLGGADLGAVVDAALRGGATVVQFRDKTSDTGALVAAAARLHRVTRRRGVPLLVNDRVDVALAVGCEGVHLGQDDMDITTARNLLGPGKIIGISANSVDEAVTACEQGADYLGIGTIFSTQTKKDTKSIIGPEGLSHILDVLHARGYGHIPTVCIGGINTSNVSQVMFRGGLGRKAVDGVAVVSAIVAAADPEAAARSLLRLVRRQKQLNDHHHHHQKNKQQSGATTVPFLRSRTGPRRARSAAEVLGAVPGAVRAVHARTPLTHNMTNLVVQNFAANVALAVGASPIMANYGEEAADLARLGGALVVNMGTVTPEGIRNYQKAIKAYNSELRPVVFDPVGAGATAVRRAAVRDILSAGYIDVIKGNESEIKTVFGSSSSSSSSSDGGGETQRGVDSSSTLSEDEKPPLVRALAEREQAIVVMTGKTDWVSDGARTYAVANGHEYLGMVTGTGCTLGTTLSAMVAAAAVVPSSPPSSSSQEDGVQDGGDGGDKLVAVIAGLLLFEIAAEEAAANTNRVEGPGSFVPAFLDALYQLRVKTAAGDLSWLARARVTEVSS